MENELNIIQPRTSRFNGCSWFTKNMPEVFVLGCGNIGSWVSLSLARMNCSLHLFDEDIIEPHNQGCQFYTKEDTGKPKSLALRNHLIDFSDNSDIFIYGFYTEDSMYNPIIFCCADTMSARYIAFNKWKSQESREIFLDSRNSAEMMEIYAVQKGDEERYEKTLFSDSEGSDLPCNYKSTNHCALISSGLMVSAFTNYLANKNSGDSMRTVPFYTLLEIPFFTYDSTT